MAYLSGQLNAVSGSATALPQSGPWGYVVTNLSASTVAYLGGPGVTSATGLPLGTAGLPLTVPGRHADATPADTDDALYVRTSSGTAAVAFIIPTI